MTHTLIIHTQHGWRGERGKKRLIIACYYSIQVFLHWNQFYTSASHLEWEMKKENNRRRGSTAVWTAADTGELFLVLPPA